MGGARVPARLPSASRSSPGIDGEYLFALAPDQAPPRRRRRWACEGRRHRGGADRDRAVGRRRGDEPDDGQRRRGDGRGDCRVHGDRRTDGRGDRHARGGRRGRRRALHGAVHDRGRRPSATIVQVVSAELAAILEAAFAPSETRREGLPGARPRSRRDLRTRRWSPSSTRRGSPRVVGGGADDADRRARDGDAPEVEASPPTRSAAHVPAGAGRGRARLRPDRLRTCSCWRRPSPRRSPP